MLSPVQLVEREPRDHHAFSRNRPVAARRFHRLWPRLIRFQPEHPDKRVHVQSNMVGLVPTRRHREVRPVPRQRRLQQPARADL